MSRRRALLVSFAAALLAPAAATARTVYDDLQAAQTYWRSDVCAGKWQVVPDPTLPDRGHGGEATGIGFTWTGTTFDWHVERCEFTMDPLIRGCGRALIVRHEMGHFIHGPDHTGPMAPGVVDVAACPIKTAGAPPRRPRARKRVDGSS